MFNCFACSTCFIHKIKVKNIKTFTEHKSQRSFFFPYIEFVFFSVDFPCKSSYRFTNDKCSIFSMIRHVDYIVFEPLKNIFRFADVHQKL